MPSAPARLPGRPRRPKVETGHPSGPAGGGSALPIRIPFEVQAPMVTLDEAGRTARWTTLHVPPPALRPTVELAWTQELPAGAERAWRIVADASPHLLVQGLRHAGCDAGVRVRVVGARRRAVDVHVADRAWTVGVRLHAGALGRLARLRASELTDRGEDAGAVFGAAGDDLAQEVRATDSPEGIVRILFAWLERRAGVQRQNSRVTELAAALVRERQSGGVRALAAHAGLGERTLRQLCTDEIGLSPVRVTRIGRLHRALALRLRRPGLEWARIAACGGYADQSHLIRDFNALLGESPARFMARATRGTM